MDTLYDFHIFYSSPIIVYPFGNIRAQCSLSVTMYQSYRLLYYFFLSSALFFSLPYPVLYRIYHFDFDSYFYILNIDNDYKNKKRKHK